VWGLEMDGRAEVSGTNHQAISDSNTRFTSPHREDQVKSTGKYFLIYHDHPVRSYPIVPCGYAAHPGHPSLKLPALRTAIHRPDRIS
jgi:hypothetical protein